MPNSRLDPALGIWNVSWPVNGPYLPGPQKWKRLLTAAEAAMPCRLCGSENQKEFGAEINIHFPGREDLSKTAALVFPELRVCLDCGSAEFALAETELRLLREGIAA